LVGWLVGWLERASDVVSRRGAILNGFYPFNGFYPPIVDEWSFPAQHAMPSEALRVVEGDAQPLSLPLDPRPLITATARVELSAVPVVPETRNVGISLHTLVVVRTRCYS